jgi:hypothetical protein
MMAVAASRAAVAFASTPSYSSFARTLALAIDASVKALARVMISMAPLAPSMPALTSILAPAPPPRALTHAWTCSVLDAASAITISPLVTVKECGFGFFKSFGSTTTSGVLGNCMVLSTAPDSSSRISSDIAPAVSDT